MSAKEPYLHEVQIDRAWIKELNSHLKTMRVTASVRKLRAFRKVCEENTLEAVYKYKVTPLVIAKLKPRTAKSFNHPEEPLGFPERGEYYRENSPAKKDIQADIKIIKTALFGPGVYHRIGGSTADFRDAPPGKGQRLYTNFHIDRTGIRTRDVKANVKRALREGLKHNIMVMVNGDDDRCRTILLKDRSRRVLTALDRARRARPKDRKWRNESLMSSVGDIVRPWMAPKNSVVFGFYGITVHRSAVNPFPWFIQRSFMRL
ncbi:MAG: hypothetical protein AB7G06_09705 [Bdellovibrionales bacterium]